MTNEPMSSRALIPNNHLRSMIRNHTAAGPTLAPPLASRVMTTMLARTLSARALSVLEAAAGAGAGDVVGACDEAASGGAAAAAVAVGDQAEAAGEEVAAIALGALLMARRRRNAGSLTASEYNTVLDAVRSRDWGRAMSLAAGAHGCQAHDTAASSSDDEVQ